MRTIGGTCDAPTPDETPGASRAERDSDFSDASGIEDERPESAEEAALIVMLAPAGDHDEVR